jgi:hypothetical protein
VEPHYPVLLKKLDERGWHSRKRRNGADIGPLQPMNGPEIPEISPDP